MRRLKLPLLLLTLGSLTPFTSCSNNAEYKKELEDRNKAYSSYNERIQMRREARQERTDMWYDRAMGKPPPGNTGLRLPDSSAQQDASATVTDH
jgi:hypothetical protein